jgi:outer membrane protein assembly factor BamD
MHPKHPNVDYAYYLKGLANFNRGIGLLERFVPSKSAERDPGAAIQSFYEFEKLVLTFPNSKYAEDSRLRMIYLRNRLAEYEIRVARYYMQRGAYVGAAMRARGVIETYDGAPAVVEALEIMTTAYRKLDLNQLADMTEKVLKANYSADDVERYEEANDAWWKFWN